MLCTLWNFHVDRLSSPKIHSCFPIYSILFLSLVLPNSSPNKRFWTSYWIRPGLVLLPPESCVHFEPTGAHLCGTLAKAATKSSYLQLLYVSWLLLLGCALVCKRFNFFQVFLPFSFGQAILSRYLWVFGSRLPAACFCA